MRKASLFVFFVLSCFSYGQDTAFLEKLNNVKTQDDAKSAVGLLASHLKNEYSFYKLKEFDNGMLRIVYAPKGMAEETIRAQADYEDCFVADFKAVNGTDGRTYRFDKAKARYEALFPVWQHYFKSDAKPDKKTQRYTNPEKTMLFSFISLGDVWAIGR